MDDNIIEQLDRIEKMLQQQQALQKTVLNFNETCAFLELSQSHLYKLTSTGAIPHYKPNGKKIYFHREELDQWLLRNRMDTQDEIEQQAADYLINKGRVQL
ncbi:MULTISPECIES: helix-turn-helix domain-containing protein [Nonlabens]|jgi:excisionase family DNA binding protein|uniref:DNA-binding protein n=2 Tax=Nonlabens TaxID=363408 RepID=A0A1W6MIN9_9FLAO|nr:MULTISPECIES: helix-turn-helix domain-containing protein [Nonlabens]ARN77460.1 DNA-binding protein [Nonlabens spongiae]BAO56002.1 putative excisionase [Nonlabens marinus S1-08]